MSAPADQHVTREKPPWTQVLTATLIVAICLGGVWVGVPVSWTAAGSVVAMILLPRLMVKNTAPPEIRFRWSQDLRPFLLWSLVLFPPFLLGFHLWHSVVLDQEVQPTLSLDKIARFEPNLRAQAWNPTAPAPDGLPTVRMWTYRGNIYISGIGKEAKLQMNYERSEPTPLSMKQFWWANERARFRLSKTGVVFESAGALSVSVSGGWKLSARHLQHLSVTNSSDTPVRIETPSKSWLLEHGKSASWDRNLEWIFWFFLIQTIGVALPEEYFFRGFVQRTLTPHLGVLRIPWTRIEIPMSIFVASALFAVVHMVVIPSPTRLAVFFPGLIFGWMYHRSGSLTAPILFHSASNLLLSLASGIWFG